MKYTLKDEYQTPAVRDVLDRLRKARKRWREEAERTAFSLTAVTGAGKTVMAAAALEALFHGSDDHEFDADPGAVVIWFSDSPSLNEQTRFRLGQASDRLQWGDMVVMDESFVRERFSPGTIYFLNTQKLGKKSLLVRGHSGDEPDEPSLPDVRPDSRQFTIWDTIRNTIEDPALNLYLVLDEAHRGFGTKGGSGDRPTIVRRLINGHAGVPPMPIVWGVSATVDRFNEAMKGAEERSTLPNVVVDTAAVQESGLLKDVINLEIPKKDGAFDTVLLRRATEKLRSLDDAWAAYAAKQKGEQVAPLLVLQVPNKASPEKIGDWLQVVFDTWPALPTDAVANVFGEHREKSFGAYRAPYIAPERVQDAKHVRVLVAKDAINTGWDCPRAEVMVSFRPAQDHTYITQLLGRMVRTPLARRIPGSDLLNSVDCLLPHFDEPTVAAVVKALLTDEDGGDGGVPGRRVLINGTDMGRNPAVPADVWERFEALPSQAPPSAAPKPVRRLTLLAHRLANDGLVPDAGKIAHARLHKTLDGLRAELADEIAGARKSVETVEGLTMSARLRDKRMSLDGFMEAADYAVVNEAYGRARRVLSPDVARTYVDHLTKNEEPDDVEAIMQARASIAAMGLVEEVKTRLDAAADKIASDWFNEHRVGIKNLTHERRGEYESIKREAAEPQDVELIAPWSRMENTAAREKDGTETPLPSWPDHLLCGDDGLYPAELNGWERKVLERERERPNFLAWYRNPARTGQDSLGIAWRDGSKWRTVRPDFLFFVRAEDGSVAVDILDPHGTQFSDALPKLKGLAAYTAAHEGLFRRVEAVADVSGQLRALDLTEPEVRAAVFDATDAKELYSGASATDY